MGVLPHMWEKRPPFGAKRPPRYITQLQSWILSLIMTYDNSNSIVTNTYLILYITVVRLNLTTQLSAVCVISIILYKYLTIFDKHNCTCRLSMSKWR